MPISLIEKGVYNRQEAGREQNYSHEIKDARSFAPACAHKTASALMFATKESVGFSCRQKTLAFLSFHTSQITSRVRLLPALREAVVDVVIISHQSCRDAYALHSLGLQLGCWVQEDMNSQTLLVYLQSARRCFAVSIVR